MSAVENLPILAGMPGEQGGTLRVEDCVLCVLLVVPAPDSLTDEERTRWDAAVGPTSCLCGGTGRIAEWVDRAGGVR